MQPIISARVITYNHEKFIAQCIEGILMQKTDFLFEIVIGEDCSTDRTREIVLEYGRRYPNKIRVITSENNVGAAQNTLRVGQACRGKYHAFCEGDDYWIDPLKLQKQADLLEAHPDYSLCFHNALIISETSPGTRLFFASEMPKSLNFADACQNRIPLASVLVRSEIIESAPKWRTQVWCPDVVLRLWSAYHGPLGYLNEIMAVYRICNSGAVARAGSWHQQARDEELFLYEQLDKDTNYQYTEVLQSQIKQVKEKFRRNQNPKGYYLTHPEMVFRRIGEYYRAMKNYQAIKHFGNSR